MFIDTHCHLDIEDYENIDLVIEKMNNNIMIACGTCTKTNSRVIELISKYDNIYGTIGIHPEEIDDNIEKQLEFIKQNVSNPKIVGIGEIGLDYYWNKENKDTQVDVFIKQIEIAKKYNKPIVIHSREAIEDTYEILEKHLGNIKAVLHCYSSSAQMALKFRKLGVLFGIGGVVTFKNGTKLQEVVKELDMEDFLLETDSPYLTPEPFRGSKNEPYNVIYVAEKIAQIRQISTKEVIDTTTKNAVELFDLNVNI